MGVLDFFFPKRCVGCKKMGGYICPNCFASISFDTQSICTICNKPSIDGKTHPGCKTSNSLEGTFAAVAYKGIIRKLLYQLKYQPYLTDLIPELADLCYEALIQEELFVQLLKKQPVLVPIPLSSSRLRKRGYNQAELLAKALGKKFGLEVQPLLKRIKDTKPQYGLKREERMENMKGAFSVVISSKRSAVEKSHVPYIGEKDPSTSLRMTNNVVVLVDDVLTTGSTMHEAAKVFKKHGVREVWGVALAKD